MRSNNSRKWKKLNKLGERLWIWERSLKVKILAVEAL